MPGKNTLLFIWILRTRTRLSALLCITMREIKISEYSFNGGIRAVIPDKHILIDNSFQTKLEEARHAFKFEELGGRQSD